MSWRYSWYLQRLKYNGKHTHIVPNTSKKQENTLIVNHALGSVGYVMHLECDSPTDLYFRQPSRTIQEFTLVLPMRVRSYRSTYPVSLIDGTVDAKGPKHFKEFRPRAINATSHMNALLNDKCPVKTQRVPLPSHLRFLTGALGV
jgi:hypothetical protein